MRRLLAKHINGAAQLRSTYSSQLTAKVLQEELIFPGQKFACKIARKKLFRGRVVNWDGGTSKIIRSSAPRDNKGLSDQSLCASAFPRRRLYSYS